MLIFQAKLLAATLRLRRNILLAAGAGLLLAGCGDNSKRAFEEAQAAQALFEAGNLPGAREAVARALALRGDQVDLLLLDGRIRYRMGDVGGAYESYSMALAVDPNQPEALQAVSQIGASIGRDRESTAATDQILMLEPNNVPALLVKGVRLLGRRDLAGARAIGDRMLATNPNSEPGVVLKARAMFLAGERAEAMTLLRDAVKRLGPTQMIVTALLECARDLGDGDVMIAQYHTLGELVPRNVDLTLDEANVQYKRERREDARTRTWALLTENGDKPAAMQRLDELWSEYDSAPLTPAQITKLGTDGAAPARLMVARFYLARGDAATAATLVESLGGDDAAGLKARIAYVTSGGAEIAAAEQILKRDGTNCDALAVRASDAIRRGRGAEAVTAAQVITTECPDRDGHALLARAYGVKDESAGQRRAFLEGIRSRPLSASPVAGYINWLIANKQGDQAVTAARRFTQRAPAKIGSWRLLKAACARASQPACVAEATAGEAAARKSYAIDLPPGQRRINPLLGNTWR